MVEQWINRFTGRGNTPDKPQTRVKIANGIFLFINVTYSYNLLQPSVQKSSSLFDKCRKQITTAFYFILYFSHGFDISCVLCIITHNNK